MVGEQSHRRWGGDARFPIRLAIQLVGADEQITDESDVRRRMRSAGTRWFFSGRTRSPTHMEEGGTERVGGESPSNE